jgi:hypothetical protein
MSLLDGSYYNNILNSDTIPTWPAIGAGSSGVSNNIALFGANASNPILAKSNNFNFGNTTGAQGDSFYTTQANSGGLSEALLAAIQQTGGLPEGLSVPSPINPNTQAGKDATGNVESFNALGYYALVSQNPKLWNLYLQSLQSTDVDAENKRAASSHIGGYNAEKGILLKQAAEQRLKTKGSTVGKCARGVNDVLQSLGINISRGDAYQQADKLANNSNFKQIKGVKASDLKNLPAGAIVVWNKTSKSPYGHISIATGDGYEISDHKQKQITSLRGDENCTVFIPV